ncbi:hypothetical protein Bp8pS_169 [Bacillus phage vB_BpuM-BpSp]|nr:hypothetical protein Bp8pS_169 [Bacillus phage vB_BpuM-BpSp]
MLNIIESFLKEKDYDIRYLTKEKILLKKSGERDTTIEKSKQFKYYDLLRIETMNYDGSYYYDINTIEIINRNQKYNFLIKNYEFFKEKYFFDKSLDDVLISILNVMKDKQELDKHIGHGYNDLDARKFMNLKVSNQIDKEGLSIGPLIIDAYLREPKINEENKTKLKMLIL